MQAPFKPACPFSPTMMWSCTEMPSRGARILREPGRLSLRPPLDTLPGVARDALAGVAAGYVGERAVKSRSERDAVQPLHFGGGGDQRAVAGLRRAVDDEACAGQGLEGRGEGTVRIEVVRPGGTAAQRQDRIVDGKGFVGAQAELATRRGNAFGGIGQREGGGAGERAFG